MNAVPRPRFLMTSLRFIFLLTSCCRAFVNGSPISRLQPFGLSPGRLRLPERNKPGDEKRGNSRYHPPNEEVSVSKQIAHPTAEHRRDQKPQLHQRGRKCIMRHLVLAGCNLLHHEQSQSDKAKSVAEVFKDNQRGNCEKVHRLNNGHECVNYKREVEKRTQNKKGFPKATVGCKISREN